MSKIKISKADLSDIDSLSELASITFFESYHKQIDNNRIKNYIASNFSPEHFKSKIESSNTCCYLATYEETIAGFMQLKFDYFHDKLEEISPLEIERIYILNKYQGKGLGKALINVAINTAIENKYEAITLAVWEENKKAISFYNYLGFKTYSNIGFPLIDIIYNDIAMIKYL